MFKNQQTIRKRIEYFNILFEFLCVGDNLHLLKFHVKKVKDPYYAILKQLIEVVKLIPGSTKLLNNDFAHIFYPVLFDENIENSIIISYTSDFLIIFYRYSDILFTRAPSCTTPSRKNSSFSTPPASATVMANVTPVDLEEVCLNDVIKRRGPDNFFDNIIPPKNQQEIRTSVSKGCLIC